MKKLILLSILLIVGCDETVAPLTIHGCIDSQACNYDADATIDDNSCLYETDCAGVCGGSAIIDCAGYCGGSALVDIAGNCHQTETCSEDISDWYGMRSYEAYNCSIDVNSTDPDATQNGNCICQCQYGTYNSDYDASGPCDGVTSSLITLIASSCWWPEQCYSYCESYCLNTHIECPTSCF